MAFLSTRGPSIIEFPPNTHMLKKIKKALFQVRLCSRLLCFCSERSRRSRCASLCQCYRLDFPSRGCVSYLPYFASFVFLLNTLCAMEQIFKLSFKNIQYIYISIHIYKLFPSVHQIALYYDHCKKTCFHINLQLNFPPSAPQKLVFLPPELSLKIKKKSDYLQFDLISEATVSLKGVFDHLLSILNNSCELVFRLNDKPRLLQLSVLFMIVFPEWLCSFWSFLLKKKYCPCTNKPTKKRFQETLRNY